MKKHNTKILLLGLIVVVIIILTAFRDRPKVSFLSVNENLKDEALHILNTKCNTCHRKQNPFMVFNSKNMEKRAPRIYKAVFVEERMPKGTRLTIDEYKKLSNWLITLKTITNGTRN
ncbi:MAG: hypothetical protein WAU36_07200 [Cyclobacteriaceae bacterium]